MNGGGDDYRDRLRKNLERIINQPTPPPAHRMRTAPGPTPVELPPETAPSLGAVPFNYEGVVALLTNHTWEPMLGFTVPPQLNGIVLGAAASSYTPVDNDEIEVELHVNAVPVLDRLTLNPAPPGPFVNILDGPLLSGDLLHPSEIWIPLRPGDEVVFSARRSNVMPLLLPFQRFPVRGRIVGRYWSRAQSEFGL